MSARPINELTGIKKPSSVLVRGFSAMEIAKQAGLIPGNYDEVQYQAWLRGPRGFSDYDLWLTLPGNAGKTITEYFNFLGLAEAIANGAALDQLALDVAQLAIDAAALSDAANALQAALALDTSTLAPKASPTFTGVVDVSEQFRLSGDATEAQITGSVNDYNPTGLATQTILRISSSTTATITGLAGGSDGRIALLENVGAFTISLSNGDSSSVAGNRFAFISNAALIPTASVLLIYDAVISRWRILSNRYKADASFIRAGGDDEGYVTSKGLSDSAAWIASSGGEITTPAGVRTVTFDMTKGFNRQDTLTANTTYAKPTGMVDGVTYSWMFLEDATGGRTITLNAAWIAGSVAFVVATGANAYNILTGTYHAGLDKVIGCSMWKSA